MAADGSTRVDEDRLPIAPSKFGAPMVPAGCVGRPRLAEKLTTGDWRVALVSAGPACGKTVAAAQWFQLLGGTRQWVTLDGADDQPVRFWRESLSALCTAATNAGFLIEKVIEPVPAETMRDRYPEDYERLSREPGFLILRLLKTARPTRSSVS